MPLFDLKCRECGVIEEHYVSSPDKVIYCRCGGIMDRLFSGSFLLKMKYPLWVDRLDEHQKRQEERGEKITVPHPSKII